jgi:hypothetical protein
VQDSQGNTLTRPNEVVNAIVSHLRQTCDPIHVDNCTLTTMQKFIHPMGIADDVVQLEQPITIYEICTALRRGARHKSPGNNDISLEFYVSNWDTIRLDLAELLNQTFIHKNINPRQKHGILVCLPKLNGDHTPEGYRPISLLTTDYKILARILAKRLRLFLAESLQRMQYCGVPGKSILDAVAKVRDIPAHYETTDKPLCILSLDFHNAFDCISHEYLFRTLRTYGISDWFIERIKALYTDVTSSVQINGTLAGPIFVKWRATRVSPQHDHVCGVSSHFPPLPGRRLIRTPLRTSYAVCSSPCLCG